MKRLVRAQFYVLGCQPWLPLLLLGAAVASGLLAGGEVRALAARSGDGLSPRSLLALSLETRRAAALLGGVFAVLWAGLGLARGGLNGPLCRGYGRGSVYAALLPPLLASLVGFSLVSQLTVIPAAGVDLAALPAAWVLRCLGLRLLLDLGLALTPFFLRFLLRDGFSAPLLAIGWGLLLYLKLPVTPGLWLPGGTIPFTALWPLLSGALSLLLGRLCF